MNVYVLYIYIIFVDDSPFRKYWQSIVMKIKYFNSQSSLNSHLGRYYEIYKSSLCLNKVVRFNSRIAQKKSYSMLFLIVAFFAFVYVFVFCLFCVLSFVCFVFWYQHTLKDTNTEMQS